MAKTQISALALLMALTAPLSAQTASEAPADPSADNGLSMGVEAQDATVGQSYIAGSFQAWEQRCIRTESGADPCVLYALLKDGDGASVAEFSVFGLPEGTEGPAVAGANFIAPLETLLTAGLSMQIDSQPAKTYPFSVCTTTGCIARVGFTADELDALKKGAEVTFVLVPFTAPDARVTLKQSLSGFTAGMEAVDTANVAADAAAAAAGNGQTGGTTGTGEAAPSP